MLSIVALFALAASTQAGVLDGKDFLAGVANPMGTTKMPWTKPWFCHSTECPKFSIASTTNEYEIRQYEPSVWVSTNITVPQIDHSATALMFWKLFAYISGNNTAHMKIAMTSPVVTTYKENNGMFDLEMNFMVPFALQANPPMPSESSVHIHRVPAMKIIAKAFPGFDNEKKDEDMVKQLKMELNDPTLYDNGMYATAGYDGPYTFSNRHNEVWLMATR